jgi:hypothetical protein
MVGVNHDGTGLIVDNQSNDLYNNNIYIMIRNCGISPFGVALTVPHLVTSIPRNYQGLTCFGGKPTSEFK